MPNAKLSSFSSAAAQGLRKPILLYDRILQWPEDLRGLGYSIELPITWQFGTITWRSCPSVWLLRALDQPRSAHQQVGYQADGD